MVFWTEALAAIVLFTFMILIPLYRNPVWWIADYPEDIQEEYFKTHERIPAKRTDRVVILKKSCALLVFAVLLCVLAKIAGAHDFTSGFRLSYGLWMLVNWYDCFFLDWVLFANIKAIRLPGTEHMDKAYHQKWYHFKGALIGCLKWPSCQDHGAKKMRELVQPM